MSEHSSDDANRPGEEEIRPDKEQTEARDSDGEDLQGAAVGGPGRPVQKERKPWVEIKRWNLSETSREQVEVELKVIMQEERKADVSGLKIKGKSKEGWRWKTISKTKYSSGTTEWYRCPLGYRCHCPCELSIYEDHHVVILRIKERHDENSHVEDHSKFLKTVQLAALRKQLLSNPVQAPSDVRVGVNYRSPE